MLYFNNNKQVKYHSRNHRLIGEIPGMKAPKGEKVKAGLESLGVSGVDGADVKC